MTSSLRTLVTFYTPLGEEVVVSDAERLVPSITDNARRCQAPVDHLADISVVIRRVVSARVAHREVVEDLTQETLVRVAGVERKLAPEAMKAYAIVTARHLVVDHAQTTSMHRRHQHRLVEYTTLDGPEELTLQRELAVWEFNTTAQQFFGGLGFERLQQRHTWLVPHK